MYGTYCRLGVPVWASETVDEARCWLREAQEVIDGERPRTHDANLTRPARFGRDPESTVDDCDCGDCHAWNMEREAARLGLN